jgi:hypothetical protein
MQTRYTLKAMLRPEASLPNSRAPCDQRQPQDRRCGMPEGSLVSALSALEAHKVEFIVAGGVAAVQAIAPFSSMRTAGAGRSGIER